MYLWLLAIGAVILFVWLGLRARTEAGSLTITRVDVPVDGLPPELDGFTILHLSDLHLRGWGPFEQALVQTVRSVPTPAVALTGDFLGAAAGATALIPIVMEIGRDRVVYGVLGNHDYLPQVNTRSLANDLARAGVRLLVNGADVIRHRGRRVWIIGVDDPHTGRDDLQQALSHVLPPAGEQGEPRILLAHSPDIFPAAARAGVDLVLAGHTHGGQICLPGGVPIITNTRRGRFGAGLFRRGRTTMFVTRGIGTSGLRGRLFCPPEIAVVRLVRPPEERP